MKKMIKSRWCGLLLTAPVLLGCFVFYIISFGMVVKNSMYSSIGSDAVFSGFENYSRILGNGLFQLAIGNSVKFLCIGLPVIFVISFGIALILKSHANQYQFLKSVFLLPYIMPVTGVVVMIDVLFSRAGFFNKIVHLLGLPAADWLNSTSAFWIVLCLYLWKNVGYSIILLLAGLITIPEDQYKTAELDGAGTFQKLIYITLPQMKYSIFMACLFNLINAFKCFREIFLVGGEHPNRHIYMIQHFINNCFENLNLNKLSAASVLVTMVLVVVISVAYALFMRKEGDNA